MYRALDWTPPHPHPQPIRIPSPSVRTVINPSHPVQTSRPCLALRLPRLAYPRQPTLPYYCLLANLTRPSCIRLPPVDYLTCWRRCRPWSVRHPAETTTDTPRVPGSYPRLRPSTFPLSPHHPPHLVRYRLSPFFPHGTRLSRHALRLRRPPRPHLPVPTVTARAPAPASPSALTPGGDGDLLSRVHPHFPAAAQGHP